MTRTEGWASEKKSSKKVHYMYSSGGETVDDCSGLLEVNGDEFEDSTEFKHVVLATAPVIPASIASIGSSATLGAAAPATPGSGSGRSHKGGSSSRSSSSSLQGSSGPSQQQQRSTTRRHMEEEKRMRRAIANSNERRRMQSINAGFQSLRSLLPHHEGEKLSKVSATHVPNPCFNSRSSFIIPYSLPEESNPVGVQTKLTMVRGNQLLIIPCLDRQPRGWLLSSETGRRACYGECKSRA
ncbi:hypothetical protein QAD02_003999 [Eretmocerus hayati]|uniref:Uncharacterized protein n=1 Tax=Eretmocerus hayati TaxID=131215 RepID=A0ACC2NQZ4_9HYME|nr:hypothetical protein QAD02_003999 [Eretmocerus hayati]